ncbi:hypothetical protein [Desulfonatronum thioautotrophicum]|uniref:hypothetical protein n=1 Tax=Desulfonatronum thioautotrophicum TaxID=617001 RepID=UPI0005EBACB9|nr:hypothetical protein [Desulfonatronum thioautotrophicum]
MPELCSTLPEAWRVPDDVLAQAYADVSDVDRSWIKKNIAQLYALHPPAGVDRLSRRISWSGGFSTSAHRYPRPWACLLSSRPQASPAQILAALVPVMTAGITDILAILDPASMRSARVLTSLELCGVEQIYAVPTVPMTPLTDASPSLPSETVGQMLHHLVAAVPTGLILDLDGALRHGLLAWEAFAQVVTWSPGPVASIRIWCDAPDEWNWPTLEWNHPEIRIEAWGAFRETAPDHIPRSQGSWDAFQRPDGSVLGISAHLLPTLNFPHTRLILTPGQEGCWVWPELHPEALCFLEGMALSDT